MPTAAPKKPEKAPFFLPSLQERQANPAIANTNTTQDLAAIEQERSRIMKMDRQNTISKFTSLLRDASDTGDFASFIAHLKSLNPAAADIEIRSLSSPTTSFDPESDACNELVAFVRALSYLCTSKRDFELGQAWMAVFLKVHSDVVIEDSELRESVKEWRDRVVEEKERVEMLAQYCGGMVGFLRAARV
ncbi:U3 small nucleolar RNA-associated protein, partial [Aureobasidium melanogenum]